MGCDYFIYTYLEITHTLGVCYFQLKTKRGHYTEFHENPADSDEDFSGEESERKADLQKIKENYIDAILKPTPPKTLYFNKSWTAKEYEPKYKTYIDTYIEGNESPYGSGNHFKDWGEKLTDFANILIIKKVEYRIDFLSM